MEDFEWKGLNGLPVAPLKTFLHRCHLLEKFVRPDPFVLLAIVYFIANFSPVIIQLHVS